METFVGMQTSPETRRAYERDLRVFRDWLAATGRVEPLADPDAIAFRDHLVASFAPAGAARVWSTVRSYQRFTHRAERSAFDYVKGPRRTKDVSPKVPGDEDVDALLGAVWDAPRDRLVIALLLNGLRASEVTDLRKADLEAHQGAAVLRVVGKGQKERLVPMTVEAQQAFTTYAAFANTAQRESAYVVTCPSGHRLTLRQVEHIVYRAAAQAGLRGMHPHALRHHYATRLIRAGATPLHVQRLLGHSSVQTTQVYVTLDLADLIEAAGKDPRNQTTPQSVRVVA